MQSIKKLLVVGTIVIAGIIVATGVRSIPAPSGPVSTSPATLPRPTANSPANFTTVANKTTITSLPNNPSVKIMGDNRNNISTSARVLKIALVKPTFTFAAYQNQSFYNFYHKYEHVPAEKNVTTDLGLLNERKIPSGPFFLYNTSPKEDAKVPQQDYYDAVMKLVKQKMRNDHQAMNISNITDVDVHEGRVFASDNSSKNAYDVLLLFHQEYATIAEYENLEKFVVQNGGTIVFDDGNILTTEVAYDHTKNTITLVRGHTWQYNGITAWRTERERWANETQQWVGSNFLQDPTKDSVKFSNNPFHYVHSEEQYVTNSKDRIIFDFGAKESKSVEMNNPQQIKAVGEEKVAVYELESGKGKVIMIGIFAHKLAHNKAFLDFYDQQIIPRIVD